MKQLLALLISNLVLISAIVGQEVPEKDEKNPESISESIFDTENQKKR